MTTKTGSVKPVLLSITVYLLIKSFHFTFPSHDDCLMICAVYREVLEYFDTPKSINSRLHKYFTTSKL